MTIAQQKANIQANRELLTAWWKRNGPQKNKWGVRPAWIKCTKPKVVVISKLRKYPLIFNRRCLWYVPFCSVDLSQPTIFKNGKLKIRLYKQPKK